MQDIVAPGLMIVLFAIAFYGLLESNHNQKVTRICAWIAYGIIILAALGWAVASFWSSNV